MYPPNLKSKALPVPEIRGVGKLQNPNFEEGGGHRGSGMVPSERALVSSYMPSIHIIPRISTRLPEILDCSFEWGLRTPNFGEGEAIGHLKERW